MPAGHPEDVGSAAKGGGVEGDERGGGGQENGSSLLARFSKVNILMLTDT